MAPDPKKAALRKVLLEKRDAISYDLIKIASQKIFNRLKKIKEYNDAKVIACYYPIGSEVLTQDIMLDALSQGKQVCLPKVTYSSMNFREVKDMKNLEMGLFDIMEPKEDCKICDKIDVVIVPTVGISRNGSRLGYGHGYYDRFLSTNNSAVSIALTYSKQIIKNIPSSDNDVQINWIVTEDEFFKASS